MSRLATCSWCATTLVLGIILGTNADLRLARRLQAEPSEGNGIERGYRELQGTRTALHDASELLAKISRITTNSVVHIQSERKTPRGRMVEETGSGVIMESTKARGFFVVSNNHVVDETPLDQISIHLHDGRVIHPTRIWTDKATDVAIDRKSTRLNSSHIPLSRMPSSA